MSTVNKLVYARVLLRYIFCNTKFRDIFLNKGYDRHIGRYVVKATPTKDNSNSAWVADGSHRITAIQIIWEKVRKGELKKEQVEKMDIPRKVTCLIEKLYVPSVVYSFKLIQFNFHLR